MSSAVMGAPAPFYRTRQDNRPTGRWVNKADDLLTLHADGQFEDRETKKFKYWFGNWQRINDREVILIYRGGFAHRAIISGDQLRIETLTYKKVR